MTCTIVAPVSLQWDFLVKLDEESLQSHRSLVHERKEEGLAWGKGDIYISCLELF
jgi:hypothetical protein